MEQLITDRLRDNLTRLNLVRASEVRGLKNSIHS